MPTVVFCSRCGCNVDEDDRICRCCGADSVDANVISLLKRISARRSRRGRDEDAGEDDVIPL
jgi:RNA polymerase subunit RPABC4/transcription elongation factor Spt4